MLTHSVQSIVPYKSVGQAVWDGGVPVSNAEPLAYPKVLHPVPAGLGYQLGSSVY